MYLRGGMVSALHHPCALNKLPFGTYVVIVRVSVARLVSQTSFEMRFLRTELDGTNVPSSLSTPCVGGWIIHPPFSTKFVNDTAWTQEGPMSR